MSSTSSNGTDLYSTTSRFSKAVSATASAFITPSEGDSDTLLSNSSYKNAMREVLRDDNSLSVQRRRHDPVELFTSRFTASSTDYYKKAFETSKTAYKLLTHISDQLLDEVPGEVPASSASFSLFQGFNAALPDVDEEIQLSKHLKKSDLFMRELTHGEQENYDENNLTFKLPNGITKRKITESCSTSKLNNYKQQLNDDLDLLEIKKNLAATEIIEIDSKINKLQELRNLVFKRVAKFEQNELFLEAHLQDITDRIQMIKDYNMEKPEDEEVSQIEKRQDTPIDTLNESVNEDDRNTPLVSKSIYGKLQVKPPRFRKKSRNLRKTTPTLQQYYEPGSEIRSIQAHEESVTCFDFDVPFGTLVTASLDNTVKVWDLCRGKSYGMLEGHNAPVSSIQMDENLVITGSLDASLKLWDLSRDLSNEEDGPLIHSFESHMEEITSLSFHNFNLVSGSQDRTIRQWDLQTGHCLQTIDVLWASQMNHSTTLDASVAINKTNPFIGALQTYDAALATGTSDGLVRLWDLRSGDVVRTLVGHIGPLTALQFDEKHLTTGSLDRSIRIWDLRTGGIYDAYAYESPISSLQFDSRRIVSSNKENTVKIYDRIEETHSSCGGKNNSAKINYVRYREGYLVEGRVDGKIGVWAI